MTGKRRLCAGGRIDRTQRIAFRFDGEAFEEHFAAARMDDPGGRADLDVRKCPQVFLEKIYQSALALEHGKDGKAGGMKAFRRQLDGLWSGLKL